MLTVMMVVLFLALMVKKLHGEDFQKMVQPPKYNMDSDGKNTKKITNLNAMSWAPFYHPFGEYIR